MKRKKVRIKGKKEEEEIGGARPLIATHLVGDWTQRDASLKGSSYTISKRENKKMCENKKRIKEDEIEEVITNLIREHIRGPVIITYR